MLWVKFNENNLFARVKTETILKEYKNFIIPNN